MEEKEKQVENEQNNHPKKADPDYVAFMREHFKAAASNMLWDDEI